MNTPVSFEVAKLLKEKGFDKECWNYYTEQKAILWSIIEKVIVYPAHGAGSACGKNIGKETFSTIGEQRANNYALQPMTKAQFIAAVTANG